MAQHTKENEEEDVFEPVVEVSEDVFEPEVVVSEDVFEPVVEVAEDVFEPEVVVAEEVFEPVDEQGNTIAAKTETVVTGERPYPLKDAESEGITANLMATMEVIDRPRAAMVSGVIEAIEQDDFDLAAIQAEMGVGIKGEDHPMLGEYLEAKIEQIKSNPDEYPISNVVVKSLDYVLNIPYEGYKIWANDVEKNSALTGSVLALISCGNDKECQQGRIENVITPLLQSTEQSIEKRKEGTFTTGVAYGIGFAGDVLLDPVTYTNPILKWTKMGLRVMIPDAAMIKMVETTSKTKKQIKEAFLSTNTGQKLTEASDFVWALFSTKHDLKKLGVEGSKAYDLASKFKNLIAAARVKAVRDNIELQKRIRQFSKDINVPIEDINKFITEAVERGGIPNVDVNHLSPETLKILAHNDDIRYEVWSLAKKNEAQLAAEVNAGVKLTPMREQPLITKDGDATLYLQYMNHAIKPEALKAAKKIEIRESGGKSLAAFFNSKHSSTFKRREDWLGLTINDINKLAKRGELPGYEGQVFKGGFFYDDPSILQALRDNKHYRSLAAVELAGDVIGPQGFGVSPTELIGLAKAAGWKTSKTRKKLTANEALKYLQEHSPREWMGWKITKNKYTNDWALPDDIAKFVDDNLVYLNDPKKVNMFLGQYDELTRWWKSWTLSVFPSYHIRNAVGNSWNNFVIGVKPQTYKDALLVQRGIAKNEAGTILINGKKVSYNQIRDWSDEFGVTGRGLFTSDIETSLKMEMGEGKWMTLSSKNKAIEYGKRVGEAVEDNARFANFIDGLRKGMKPEAAAKRVRKTLFDYSDLTDFEQQVMKRIFPFYTWTRKNVPFQLEQLVKHPGKYKAIDTLRQEVEAAAGKLDDNEKYLSEWMLANYPTKVKVEGGEARYFILGGWWAGADLWKLGSQPTKLATDLLHPVLKSMLEASTQLTDKKGYVTDLFSGQKLHPEMPTDYLWGTTSETTKHYLNNLRVLNTIDEFVRAYYNEKGEGPKKLSPFVKEPKTIEEALLAFFTGIRTFSVDLERQKLFFTQGKGKESELYKELVSKAIKAGRTDEEIKVLMDKGIESIQDLQGMATGGLVSQAERLGFNKGGAVSQEDITAVTDEWSKTPSDIGNAWKKRATSMQTTMQGARDSEIKPLQYAWNTASDIAGGVWDTGEEILEPVIDTVQLGAKATFPDAYAATAEALTDAGKQILDSDIGKKGLETAKDIYEWFQGFKKENPHDAKSIEGIGNLFPIAIGAKAVNKTLKNQMDTLNTKSTYQYKPNSDTPYLDMDNEKINKVNKFFNPDVINKALQSKDKNTKVVYMTPGEFLTLAKTHTSDGETKKLDRINNAINEGIQLEDIPTLTIKAGKDGNSQVTKHDGRHRANALYELGEDLIPVRVKTTGNKDNKKLSTVTNEDGLEVYTFPAYSSLIYDRHHLGTVESYDTKKPKAAMPAKKTKEVRDNEFKELAKGLTESGGFKYKLPTMLLDLALKDKVGLSKPKQWKYSLSQWAKKGKIKQEELDDSMLMKWLDTIDVDGKLSTKDIFNFMRDNSPMLKTYTSKIQSKVDTEWLDKQPLQQEKIKLQDNAHNKFQEVIYLRDLSNITDISSDNKKLVKTTAEMMHHAIVENIINYMHSPSFIDNQLMDFLTNSPYTLKAIQRKAVDANLLNKPNSIFHPDHQQLDNKEYIREAAVELVSEVTPDKRNSYIVGAIIEDLNQAYLKAEGREKEVLSKYVNIFMDSYKAKIKQIRFGIENVTELRKLSEEALRRNAGDVNPSTWSSFSLPNMKGKPVTILVQSKVGTDDRLKKLRDFRAEVSEHSKGPYIGHSSELSITGLTTKLNDPTTLPLSAKERIETVRKLKRSKQTFKEKTGVTWEDRQTYLDNLEGNIYTEEHWTGTYGESPLKKGIPQENIIISIRGNVIEQGSLGESRGLFISEQQAQPHQTAMANKKQLDVLGNNLFKNITGYSALDSGAKIKELQRKLKSSEARKRAISGKYRKLQKDYSERYEELEGQARASILAEVKRDGYELTEQELATEVAIRVWRVVDNNYNMYDPKLKSINNQQEYNIKVTSKLNAQEADIAIQIRQLTNSLGTMVNALPENLSHKKDWTPLAMKQSIKYAIDNNLNYLVLPIEKHSIQQIEQWGDREPAVLTAILDRNSIYSPRAYRDIVKKWDKDAKPFNDEYLDRDKQGDWDENDIHKVIVLPITDAIRAGYKKDGLTAYRRGGLVTQMKALIPNG